MPVEWVAQMAAGWRDGAGWRGMAAILIFFLTKRRRICYPLL